MSLTVDTKNNKEALQAVMHDPPVASRDQKVKVRESTSSLSVIALVRAANIRVDCPYGCPTERKRERKLGVCSVGGLSSESTGGAR